MPRSARDRERRPGRRPAFREPRRRILVVCEGVVTEPQYLNGLARHFRNQLVEVKIIACGAVPLTLVKSARDLKKEADGAAKRERDVNLKYDDVWCVFDFDEHPHIPESRIMAAKAGINLAISNPCFELWLLLHFRDSPGALSPTKARALLKKHLPKYDKSVDFADCADGYSQAVIRGKRGHSAASADGEPGRNPSTNVYELTEIIRTPS